MKISNIFVVVFAAAAVILAVSLGIQAIEIERLRNHVLTLEAQERERQREMVAWVEAALERAERARRQVEALDEPTLSANELIERWREITNEELAEESP